MTTSVIYNGIGKFEVESGRTILETSEQLGLFHPHECGGRAQCSTCRVWIMNGSDNCSPMTDDERRLLAARNLGQPVRLACQTKILGPLRLQILLRDQQDVEHVVCDEESRYQTLHGSEMPVAILCAAIHNFETFAEENLPYDIIHVLNKAQAILTKLIAEHGGAMAGEYEHFKIVLFGVNQEIRRAITEAVTCSRRMVVAFQELNEYLKRHFDVELQLGVGVHADKAVVGHVGSVDSRRLAVIGKAVDIAYRLLDLTRETKAGILISESVFAVVRDRLPIRRAYSARLPGMEERSNVFEVSTEGENMENAISGETT